MRALVLVVLVAFPAVAAPSKDKAKCSAALSAMKGAGTGPEYEKRLRWTTDCAPLFSDPVIREVLSERLLQSSPFDHAPILLAVSTGEGERKSYCISTKSTDLSGCAPGKRLEEAEANRQWKVLLSRILVQELGAKAGPELMKDFEAAWTAVFPLSKR